MNNNSNTRRPLPKDFAAFAEVLMEQNRNLNNRMGDLAQEVTALSKNVSDFLVKMGRAEERHSEDTNRMERIETNQREHGQELKDYMHNNDGRVADVERLVLILEIDKNNKSKRWTNIEKVVLTVIAVVVATAIITYLKW
ncbi:MAG: hypothetical protein GY941_05710 [Planctomycetes bacterium]|nr:hypothetical protein [Planctomycetota bacterium]